MKTVRLTVTEDSEFGGCGLLIAGMRRDETVNPARDGLQIAHDLVEHVNGVGEIGSIDDELEALGAIWFVRGQFGELRRDNVGSMYNVHENIAADVTRMFRDFFHGHYVNLKPIRTRPLDCDSDLRTILDYAFHDMLGELEIFDREVGAAKRAEYLAVCLPRMRTGYRKAQRKWGSARVANNLFWEIESCTRRAATNASADLLGQHYTLVYGVDGEGRTWVNFEEYYEEDYE